MKHFASTIQPFSGTHSPIIRRVPFFGKVRHGDTETTDIIALLALLILGSLVLGAATGAFNISKTPASTQTAAVTNCATQSPTQPWQYKYISSAYGGDAAQTSPSASQFAPSGSNLLATPGDAIGSISSAVTSVFPYTLQQGIITQVTATTAYQIWAPISSTALTPVTTTSGAPAYQYRMDGSGIPVVTVGPAITGSTAGTCLWPITYSNIQAPASGASATTNVAATATSPCNALTSASTGSASIVPATSCRIDFLLNFKGTSGSYKGAMYNTQIWGTQQNPVQLYSLPSGAAGPIYGGTGTSTLIGSAQFQGMALFWANDSTVQLNIDPAASALYAGGLTIYKVTNIALSSGTQMWVVPIPNGCTPAGNLASGAQQTCSDVPVDINQPTTTNGHLNIFGFFVDGQEPGYTVSNGAGPAKGSAPSSGAAAGTPTSVTGLTPTGGNNAGAPTILIKQSFDINFCNSGTCT